MVNFVVWGVRGHWVQSHLFPNVYLSFLRIGKNCSESMSLNINKKEPYLSRAISGLSKHSLGKNIRETGR